VDSFFNNIDHLFSPREALAMEPPDSRQTPTDRPDPILLALFNNRFMSVAEAMGRSLQQTSISTNIKERLDFSCALFAPDGDLVANAPFIPIHLGAMSL
jgi:5-oxoprolinase (ATP-hydrolysing)